MVQATAHCSGYQKSPGFLGTATICTISYMVNRSKYIYIFLYYRYLRIYFFMHDNVNDDDRKYFIHFF